MLLHEVVFEDITRTKYKPGTGIMAAIKILRIEGNWGRKDLVSFSPLRGSVRGRRVCIYCGKMGQNNF